MKLCLQQWGMDKHYPLLHLPQDTSPFSKVLMQSNCLCPFNDRRYCMKTPGGMMKNSFNNAFPGTAKGFFPSSFLVGESCHLMSWKPWRSYSLTSHFLVTTMFSPQGSLFPVSYTPVSWYLRTGHIELLRRSGAFHRELRDQEPEYDSVSVPNLSAPE